ncbi:MAG: AAA family ATPase [Acidimicrobiia bacterium]|nr:AAA family ATPase [Acidimicrobiia bacterium]
MPGVRYVVVSGLPASGKSTVASRIAPLLGLELIDKDDILEASFPSGEIDPETRTRLSRQADHTMRKRLEVVPSACLVSHWQRPELSTSSGTPTGWVASLPDLVEVYCACSPVTAARRFLERTRHAGHGDHLRDPDLVIEQLHALAALGPLGIGKTVVVDTEGEFDVIGAVKAVSRA